MHYPFYEYFGVKIVYIKNNLVPYFIYFSFLLFVVIIILCKKYKFLNNFYILYKIGLPHRFNILSSKYRITNTIVHKWITKHIARGYSWVNKYESQRVTTANRSS